MAHLIDKSALVAEIEKRINFNEKLNAHSRVDECNAILSFIDTLEVKEVDLEKEMNDYFVSMKVQENENIFESTFRLIAKHFFNLSLKAQVNKF